MTPESRVNNADDLGSNANEAYDFESITAGLETLGFTIWRPTSTLRKLDLLARHPDGTIVRMHNDERLTVEFDHSNCDRFKNGVHAPQPVLIELRQSKNWRLKIWHWAIWRWAIWRWVDCGWALHIAPFWVRGNILYPIKQLRLRFKTLNRVRRLKPIYSESPTTDLDWRGWGL